MNDPEEPMCPKCGEALWWTDETTYSHHFGTGYMIQICEECDTEVDRRWVGF